MAAPNPPKPVKPVKVKRKTEEEKEVDSFFNNVKELWAEKEFCDIVIEVDGSMFDAHRLILAGRSPYFRAMFCSEFQEKGKSKINLQGVTAKGVKVVLDYIYSRVFQPADHEDYIWDVVQAASLLQMPYITQKCDTYINTFIRNAAKKDDSNFDELFYLTMSSMYNLRLTKFATEYRDGGASENFSVVTKSEDFYELPCLGVTSLLNYKIMKVESEWEIFDAAKRWINHDPERMDIAHTVMKCVSFKNFSKKDLDVIKSDPVMVANPKCLSLLDGAIDYHKDVYKQPYVENADDKMRRFHRTETLVLIGGHTDSWANVDTYAVAIAPDILDAGCIGEPEYEFTYWPIEGIGSRYGAQGIELNNFLFVIGGSDKPFSEARSSVHRFHAKLNSWMDLAPMIIPRAQHTAAMIGDSKILCIGGRTTLDNELRYKTDDKSLPYMPTVIQCCEIYDIRSNKWERSSCYPVRVCRAASCSVEDIESDDMVAVSGGLVAFNMCRHNPMFNPKDDK